MSGAAGGVAETEPRSAVTPMAGCWAQPVVVTGVAVAVQGELELPAELADAAVHGPFDDVRLPGGASAPAAQALVAAIGGLFADPALQESSPEQRAIVVGTHAAALGETIQFMEGVAASGPALVNPGLFPFTVMNAAAGLAAISFDCRGANVTLNNGASAPLDAVIYAADLVASGRASWVVAGGFEGLGEQVSVALGRSAPPIQLAAVVAVTREDEARARGARPLARLVSWSAGESPAGDPAATRGALVTAAREAAQPVLSDSARWGAAAPEFSHRPEATLLGMTASMARIAGETEPDLTLLAAGPEDRPAGTALVLAAPGVPE